MRILNLLRGFVVGNWLWLAIGIGVFVAGATLGYNRGYHQGYSEVLLLQHQFDQYKLEVLESVNAGNAETQSALDSLQGNLKEISQSLRIQRIESQRASDNLIMELQNYEGESCPISPAVQHYIDSVRKQQYGTTGND